MKEKNSRIKEFLDSIENELSQTIEHDISLHIVYDLKHSKLIYFANKVIEYDITDRSKGAVVEAINRRSCVLVEDITTSNIYSQEVDNPLSYKIKSLLAIPFSGNRKSDNVFAILVLYTIDKNISLSSEELAKIDKFIKEKSIEFLKSCKTDHTEDIISMLLEENKKCEMRLKRDYDFFSAMVHDIRTPMNAIMGFLELLESEVENSTLREYIRAAHKSGELITSLVNDILDMSKLRAGKIEIDKYIFTPINLFEDISNLFYYSAKKKGIYLATYFSPYIPYTIESDPYRLKQIINNFLSNALKFTPEGGTVTLEFNYDEEENRLLISVADTGIGMSQDEIERIFTPYAQASKSTASKYGGTGLGMSISKQLAALLGGKIEVVSQKGEGSIFTLSLPVKPIGPVGGMLPTIDKEDLEDIEIIIVKTEKTNRENDIVIDLIQGYINDLHLKSSIMDIQEALKSSKESYSNKRVYILDSSIIDDDNIDSIKELIEATHNHIALIESNVLLGYSDFENIPLIMRPLSPEKLFNTIIDIVEAREQEHKEFDKVKHKKTLTVLVVDDNFINLKLLAEVVKKINHKPIMARDGLEAVELFKEHKPDVIFIDKQMPKMNGIEAIKEIKKLKGSENVKIFGLTGDADKQSREEFLKAGAEDVLVKPVQIKRLISIFERL